MFSNQTLGRGIRKRDRLNIVWIVFRNITGDMLTFLYWMNEVENFETNDMNQWKIFEIEVPVEMMLTNPYLWMKRTMV